MDKRLPVLNLVLKAARKHKFRMQYIPIKYEQSAILNRTIDFNGQRYTVGLPVNSSLDWKALRLGYEYDFIIKSRGFGGFIIEDKQTDVRVDIATPLITPQFARARAPIPALGGIARVWVVPRANITAEVTGFTIPDTRRGPLRRALRRHRHLRDDQPDQQRGREDRLPIARHELQVRRGRRRVHAQRLLHRDRRAILSA